LFWGGVRFFLKYYLLQTLKELALLGAVRNKVEISSEELASQLDTSQQTASRYLLELDKKDLILREMGVKKQRIMINDAGSEILEDEFNQYRRIFELEEKLFFKGELVSGLGEGSYYTTQENYIEQFKSRLGFKPYPGTFNLKIKNVERNKLRLLKKFEGIQIESFKTDNRTFGSVNCFKASVGDVKGALVLPVRGHYSNILEFISPVYLRDRLGVVDGDLVEAEVFVEK
jgi:riboflavin kinase, archaea type